MSDGAGKYRRLLDEAIENLSQYFFDSFEHGNAEFRSSAGLPMIVIREELGDCCSWCADLAGTYDYADAPPEVWQRHGSCRCMVITRTEKGTYQDAWSRKEYQSERDARLAREEELMAEQKAAEIERKNGIALDTGWAKGYITPPDNVRELMKRYDEDVAAGWISPNAGFDNYLQQYMRIENEIIGKKTVDGDVINKQSRHFMQRVLGTSRDPDIYKEDHRIVSRSGVPVDEIKQALFFGKVSEVKEKSGRTSKVYKGENCKVSFNPTDGTLIQCNPIRKKNDNRTK